MSEQAAAEKALIEGFHALAVSTGSVIDWRYLVNLLKVAPPPLTDRERCDLILAAANGAPLAPGQWAQLMGIGTGGGDDAVALAPALRTHLTNSLNTFIESSAQKRREHTDQLEKALRYTVLQTVPRASHVISANPVEAIKYGLLVMLRGGWAAKLCRCKYSKCGAFFFARPAKGAGAPSRTYCRPKHVKPGELEQARNRMRRLRGSKS